MRESCFEVVVSLRGRLVVAEENCQPRTSVRRKDCSFYDAVVVRQSYFVESH